MPTWTGQRTYVDACGLACARARRVQHSSTTTVGSNPASSFHWSLLCRLGQARSSLDKAKPFLGLLATLPPTVGAESSCGGPNGGPQIEKNVLRVRSVKSTTY